MLWLSLLLGLPSPAVRAPKSNEDIFNDQGKSPHGSQISLALFCGLESDVTAERESQQPITEVLTVYARDDFLKTSVI